MADSMYIEDNRIDSFINSDWIHSKRRKLSPKSVRRNQVEVGGKIQNIILLVFSLGMPLCSGGGCGVEKRLLWPAAWHMACDTETHYFPLSLSLFLSLSV